jgi:hypothetical protein
MKPTAVVFAQGWRLSVNLKDKWKPVTRYCDYTGVKINEYASEHTKSLALRSPAKTAALAPQPYEVGNRVFYVLHRPFRPRSAFE